jgi:hypothetical protein
MRAALKLPQLFSNIRCILGLFWRLLGSRIRGTTLRVCACEAADQVQQQEAISPTGSAFSLNVAVGPLGRFPEDQHYCFSHGEIAAFSLVRSRLK